MFDTGNHRAPALGYPRLVFAAGGAVSTHDAQREFELVDDVTTIGSGADADLRLDELEERHAEIRRDAADEYVYVRLGVATGNTVHGLPAERVVLRTGARVELGPWTVMFYREEYADRSAAPGSRSAKRFARQRDAERREHEDADSGGEHGAPTS